MTMATDDDERKARLREAMAEFGRKVKAGSVVEQAEGFAAARAALGDAVPEPAAKALLRTVLHLLLQRYTQKTSFAQARTFLLWLAKVSKPALLAAAVREAAVPLPSKRAGKRWLGLAKLLVKATGGQGAAEEGRALVALAEAVHVSGEQRSRKGLAKLLTEGKGRALLESSLAALDKAASLDQPWALALLGLLAASSEDLRRKAVVLYTKTTASAKTAVQPELLGACQPLLQQLKQEEWESELWPLLKKGILRSPEASVAVLASLLRQSPVTLSPAHAEEVSKALVGPLKGDNAEVRQSSVEAFRGLGERLKDVGAAEKTAAFLVDVYGGKEGKLVSVESRLAVLEALKGFCESCGVSGAEAGGKLASAALKPGLFAAVAEDAPAPVRKAALAVVQTLAQRSTTAFPASLLPFFKAPLAAAKTSSALRLQLLRCLNESLTTNTVGEALPLASEVGAVVETGLKKEAGQEEAIAALPLLLRLARVDGGLVEGKLSGYWALLASPDALFLTAPKLLKTAGPECLAAMVQSAALVVSDFADKLPSGAFPREICRAFLVGLLCPYQAVRAQTRKSLKRIFGGLEGEKFASDSLACLTKELREEGGLRTSVLQQLVAAQKAAGEEEADSSEQLGKLLSEALTVLTEWAADSPGTEVEELVLAAWPLTVHAEVRRGALPRLLRKLGLEPRSFVASRGAELFAALLGWDSSSERRRGVEALVALGGAWVWEAELLGRLKALRLDQLGGLDPESAAIARTPDGVLYDQTLLDRFRQEKEAELKGANMKRENKAYKYKDQLWELELKKELAKKKGHSDETLTPKQREQVKAKLAEEAEVRKRVMELTEPSRRVLELVEAAVAETEWANSSVLPTLISSLLPLFSLHIVADRAAEVWLALARALLKSAEDEVDAPAYLPQLLATATLRLIQSKADLDPEWTQLRLPAQSKKCVQLLAEMCGLIGDDSDSEAGGEGDASDEEEGMSMPLPLQLFVFTVPMIRAVVVERRAGLSGEEQESVEELGLRLLQLHLESEEGRAYPGWLLPVRLCVSLLLDLCAERLGGSAAQQTATAALLSLVAAVGATRTDEEQTKALRTELESALLAYLSHRNETVREYSLQALQGMGAEEGSGLGLRCGLFAARWDPAEEVERRAKELWDSGRFRLTKDMVAVLEKSVVDGSEAVREPAAAALADTLKSFPGELDGVLKRLGDRYIVLSEVPPPQYDNVGRLIKGMGEDLAWESREGVAKALGAVAEQLEPSQVSFFFQLIVPGGLSDRDQRVRESMLEAAVRCVEVHGEAKVEALVGKLEEEMDALDAKDDIVRTQLVVLLGRLARHLEAGDKRIRGIVGRLMESLSTPSQRVQEAVAGCLPGLVPAIGSGIAELTEQLLGLLLGAEAYGERRGAAYGLAGLVKGQGIVALRQQGIIQTLQEALQDKKKPRYREGSLLAFGQLCAQLGRLFEPYVVQMLPSLLVALGDPDAHVRDAADECAKIVMSKLSGQGVKLILPSLLRALEEDSWRTKCGSVELLGAMAYCAPRQLSSCLPSVVPHLTEVLSDSHVKVQKAGEQALRQIGRVIRNPEMLAIVDVLLGALEDPAGKTAACLGRVLKTKFVHYVDPASLALLMPVVRRGFDDRSADTRRMAAGIVCNIYSLTENKDVEPYLGQLVPGLKKCLQDPVPEIRAVAAKAFGTMVGKGGAEGVQKELLPWLKDRLVSDVGVDRSGAAQGLAEVFKGLGPETLGRMMPDVISTAGSEETPPEVRDGYLMLYIYLPSVYGGEFEPWLGRVIPSILAALADESEFVRDTALKAGQRLINSYCQSSQDLLLPQLERGLFDEQWRIRFSSVQLLGDFLFKITGVSGKMTTESQGDDDTFGSETMGKAMSRVLGEERKNRLLAGLYIARSDVALMVRQASGHVWKIVVANTPRTLREILPLLFQLLLGCLASASAEKQQIAARCLGELVRKMGDRILVDVVPVLQEGLKSTRSDQRQGVCIALSEIMSNTTREMVLMYSASLVPTVKTALSDPLPDVRQAAASTFKVLLGALGPAAIEDVLAPLLEAVKKDPDSDAARHVISGVASVVALQGKDVLPSLMPRLCGSEVGWRALAAVSAGAGDAIVPHLPAVLHSLLLKLSAAADEDADDIREATLAILLQISEPEGQDSLAEELLATAKKAGRLSGAAAELLAGYLEQSRADVVEELSESLHDRLLGLYASDEERVVAAAVRGLTVIVKAADQRDQLAFIPSVQRKVEELTEDGADVPGLHLPKGLQPVLAVLREGVLSGSPDTKERAAKALASVIRASDAAALKPHVVNVTGPLIRILGDRFPPSVKTAILDSLSQLLEKVGVMLKPFLPQLQSTFLKAAGEASSRDVRMRAGRGLAALLTIHPKPDLVGLELVKAVRGAEDGGLAETYLVALRGVVESVGERLAEATVAEVLDVAGAQLKAKEELRRDTGAGLMGAAAAKATLTAERREWALGESGALGTLVALSADPSVVVECLGEESLREKLLRWMGDDKDWAWGQRAAGQLLLHQILAGAEPDARLASGLSRGVNHASNDVKVGAASVLGAVGREAGEAGKWSEALAKATVPMVVNGTKEKNTAVRAAAEEALVELLRLREGGKVYEGFLGAMDPGPRLALSELYAGTLLKAAKRAPLPHEPIDSTTHL